MYATQDGERWTYLGKHPRGDLANAAVGINEKKNEMWVVGHSRAAPCRAILTDPHACWDASINLERGYWSNIGIFSGTKNGNTHTLEFYDANFPWQLRISRGFFYADLGPRYGMNQRYRGTGIFHNGFMYYIGGFGGDRNDTNNVFATYHSNNATSWSVGARMPRGPLHSIPVAIRGRARDNNEEICAFGGVPINNLTVGGATSNNPPADSNNIYCITPAQLRQGNGKWTTRGKIPYQASLFPQILRTTLP